MCAPARAKVFDHTPSRKVAYFERAKDCFCQKKRKIYYKKQSFGLVLKL